MIFSGCKVTLFALDIQKLLSTFAIQNQFDYPKMKYRALRIAVFTVLSTVLASLPCRANVLGIYGEDHSSIGIYIKDLKADTVVFESDADRALIPASVMKLVISASAMGLKPSDFRFETKVYYTGNITSSGVLNGDIVIKASGDPTLESEFFPKQKGFVADIVSAVKKLGIQHINGQIVLARVAEGNDYPEGPFECWEVDDTPWAYGAGIFDFNYSDNYFGLYPATGRTVPHVPDLHYKVWGKGYSSGLDMMRGVYSDSLIIMGKDYTTNKKARVNTSMPYPFDVFRYALQSALGDAGIKVDGKRIDAQNRTLILSHSSAGLDDILKSLMVRSDNMFAEGILRTFGDRYGDRYHSIDTELEYWSRREIDTRFVTIKDGSGLSRADRVSPRFIGDILEWMAHSKMANRYVALFPVSGVNGTMKNFMAKTPLKGRLAMKTGSMSAVQSYAGYLTDAQGKPTHVVVIIANSFFCSRSELKAAISEFLLEQLSDENK